MMGRPAGRGGSFRVRAAGARRRAAPAGARGSSRQAPDRSRWYAILVAGRWPRTVTRCGLAAFRWPASEAGPGLLGYSLASSTGRGESAAGPRAGRDVEAVRHGGLR
jgi:hypothetical protein